MRSAVVSPEDVGHFLAQTDLFGALEPELLTWLASSFELVLVDAGEIVISAGDPATCLYLVQAGRLRAQRRGDDAIEQLAEIGMGESVGELALVTDRPRSATVVATRDSRLLRLPLVAFDDLVRRHPDALRALTTQVVDHLERPRPTGTRMSVLSLVPIHQSAAVDRAIDDLVSELRRGTGTVGVLRGIPDGAERHFRIHRLEQMYDLVVAVADVADPAWTRSCVHQADRVVLIADAESEPLLTDAELLVEERQAVLPVRVEFVLVHPGRTDEPRHTSRWLEHRDVARHHHLRVGDPRHSRRVARLVTDRGRGLACSGGGARALSEIGAIDVLCGHGLEIDAITGTSAGALIGGAFARGWSVDRVSRTIRRYMVAAGRPVEPTLPLVALSSGGRMTERLREVCGDLALEDLWIDFGCVSTNLTTRDRLIHRSGAAWRAIRASMSIPGLFPPVSHEGNLLVDGGVLDNLPVGVLHERHPGMEVIALDVGVRRQLGGHDLPESTVVRGFEVLRQRVSRRTGRQDLAGIGSVLARLAELGGHDDDDQQAVLTVRPDVGHIAMLDFARFDELLEAGRTAATAALEADAGRIVGRSAHAAVSS